MNFAAYHFRHLSCWMALHLSFLLILSGVTYPTVDASGSMPISRSVKTRRNAQVASGKARKVPPTPPQPGPPQAVLPNLQAERNRRWPSPVAPAAVPSTRRSKRKPLESRNGRKVGDPLRVSTRVDLHSSAKLLASSATNSLSFLTGPGAHSHHAASRSSRGDAGALPIRDRYARRDTGARSALVCGELVREWNCTRG